MSNSPDSQNAEESTTQWKDLAVYQPYQVYYKKPLALLQKFEPLDYLPKYLSPKHASDHRWPPGLYHGFPIPASQIDDHWLKKVLPKIDRSTLCEADLKSLEEPPVPDNFFLDVIFGLERKLSRAVGWKIRVLPVHGMPGDRYSRMARLRDNYYNHIPPDYVIRKLQKILGTQNPPKWYLTQGVHAQWDSFPGHNPNPRPRVSKDKSEEKRRENQQPQSSPQE
ncbi:hypothetical protein C0993_000290 [Termitomyces sp. T159_Od127]|nr:hypothetical protein C0993_000290 [Termitomyces sp. T159_Od127]